MGIPLIKGKWYGHCYQTQAPFNKIPAFLLNYMLVFIDEYRWMGVECISGLARGCGNRALTVYYLQYFIKPSTCGFKTTLNIAFQITRPNKDQVGGDMSKLPSKAYINLWGIYITADIQQTELASTLPWRKWSVLLRVQWTRQFSFRQFRVPNGPN